MESLVDQHSDMLEEKRSTDAYLDMILNLVTSKDGGVNNEDIPLLVTSIRNLYGNYQTLYGKYDHLVGELKDSVHHKSKTNGEISASISLSESDEFSEAENEFSEAELKINESFRIERELLSATIAQREDAIQRLENELHKSREKIADMEVENGELHRKLEVSHRQEADLNQRMESIQRENKALISEQSTTAIAIQDMEQSFVKLNSERDTLKSEKMKLYDENIKLQVQVDSLCNSCREMEEEQKSLVEENLAALQRIRQLTDEKSAVEESIMKLKSERDVLNDEAVKLHDQNTELRIQVDDLSNSCGEIMEQHKPLAEENLEALTRIQQLMNEKSAVQSEAEQSVLKLQLERDVMKDEETKLHDQITELQIQADGLRRSYKAIEEKHKSLAEENLAALARIQQLMSEKSEVEAESEYFKLENSMLKKSLINIESRNSELEIFLNERREEAVQLRVELEKLQKGISVEKEAMGEHANNLQRDIDSLKSQKHELEELMLILAETISKGNVTVENLESVLALKIADQEKMLNNQKDVLLNLANSYKITKNDTVRKRTEELEAKHERICQLETIIDERRRQMKKLEDSHKEALEKLKLLTSEKANADKEVKKLNELVQTLEVHLRLLDRKLKITKSEFKEKEETHKKKMKELQQKCEQMEEHCNTLYEEICYRENESEEVKEAVARGVGCLVDKIENFELVFEESCGHFQTRISECSGEIRILKEELGSMKSVKRQLEHENHEQMVRILHHEGSLRIMREEVNCLEEKLAATEDEEERLMKVANAYGEKVEALEKIVREKEEDGRRMVELERRLRESEEEGWRKDEEKREAIRQLCLSIEYHRENCDHLLRSLLTNGRRINPSA